MMADTGLIFITPAIHEALSKATSFSTGQVNLAPVLPKQFADLAKLLTEIQDAVQGAEGTQESDPAVRLWLQKLNEAVYDAVDLLDECDYNIHVLQKKDQTPSQSQKQVHAFFSMSETLNMINESLIEIRKTVHIINMIVKLGEQNSAAVRSYYEIVHLLDSSKVVGREEDVSKIVNLLNDQRKQRPISGISITGMPGVGKTTVARLVYMKAKEEKLYDVVAWVCVTGDFNHQRILGEMLEYFNVRPNKTDTTDALVHDLGQELKNKTFLLILDDVWHKDRNKWNVNDFASSLSKVVNTNGNSIVLTTRSDDVASVIEKIPMDRYDLKGLSDDQCWRIIEKVVVRSFAKTLIPSQIEVIGQDIAKPCGGLPLVATAIGGTLSSQIEANRWLAMTKNEEWKLEYRNTVFSVLKMSFFNRMPSTLKKCFSYFSIFPKGFEIKKDDLIQLWMARGLIIQHSNESTMTMEDIGNEYFDELVSISLFQDVRRDACGNVESCKMHDAVHDLALSVAQGETLIWENGSNIDDNSSARNLRIKYDGEVHPIIPSGISQKLHSLFLEGEFAIKMESDLKALRSLKLLGAQTEELPVSLDKSKHLRYLEIVESKIKSLPGSFSQLYMLQTLKVMKCSCLQKLPDDTNQLVSLRHIYVDDRKLMPKGIGHLTSLQTLPSFFVGTDPAFTIEELGGLGQLRGKLKIQHLEHVKSKSEAIRARLNEKTELFDLEFVWENRETATINNNEEVLEGLQPHSNLKSLSISNYMGKNLPLWMNGVKDSSASSLLDNLVKLQLSSCNECMCISSLGRLPCLQVLYICGMNKVRSISHEWLGCLTNLKELRMGPFSSKLEEFPGLSSIHSSLESLSLEGWDELKSLPDQLQHLTALKKLNISTFGGLEDLPKWLGNLHSLQELKIERCFKLKGQPSLQDMRQRGLYNLNSFVIDPSPKPDGEGRKGGTNKVQEKEPESVVKGSVNEGLDGGSIREVPVFSQEPGAGSIKKEERARSTRKGPGTGAIHIGEERDKVHLPSEEKPESVVKGSIKEGLDAGNISEVPALIQNIEPGKISTPTSAIARQGNIKPAVTRPIRERPDPISTPTAPIASSLGAGSTREGLLKAAAEEGFHLIDANFGTSNRRIPTARASTAIDPQGHIKPADVRPIEKRPSAEGIEIFDNRLTISTQNASITIPNQGNIEPTGTGSIRKGLGLEAIDIIEEKGPATIISSQSKAKIQLREADV